MRSFLQFLFCLSAYAGYSDSLHNSDGRPKARGRKEGEHWTAWAFNLKSNRSVFYLHMYEDGRVAKLGADTRKTFRVKDYDFLWSGEVRRSPASHCSNLTAILGDSEIDVHTTTLRPAKSINKMLAL